jgi:5-methyltetrahydrofolate--homocysteine methyltransferase
MHENVIAPRHSGITVVHDITIETLLPYIDWTFFFHQWKLNGKHPAIFSDPVKGEEAKQLYADALKMLDEIIKKKMIRANGVVGIFPAESRGDDVVVYSDTKKKDKIAVFPFLRNQQPKNNEPNLCLADFISAVGSGVNDHIGLYAATAGIGVDTHVKEFVKKSDDYSAVMISILADRLAEAFAEYMHEKVSIEIWGYSNEKAGIRPAAGYSSCPDHHAKFDIFKLLDATKNAEITLTESAMMIPAASVCGWYFAHPKAKYFNLGKIDSPQLNDYAKRKGMSAEEVEKWIGSTNVLK